MGGQNTQSTTLFWVFGSVLVPSLIAVAGFYVTSRGFHLSTADEIKLQEEVNSLQQRVALLQRQNRSLSQQQAELKKKEQHQPDARAALKAGVRDESEEVPSKEPSQQPNAEPTPMSRGKPDISPPAASESLRKAPIVNLSCANDFLHLPDPLTFKDANFLVLYQQGMEELANKIALCLWKLPGVQRVDQQENSDGLYMKPGIVRYRYHIDESGAVYLRAYLANFGFRQDDLERTTTPGLDYKFEVDVDSTLMTRPYR